MRLVKATYVTETLLDRERILTALESAGRVCWKSEGRAGPGTAPKFCRMILHRGHESVLEHESIRVRFVTSRGVTHELVRHRLASYSQESTRYCNYEDGLTFVVPPWHNIVLGEYGWDERSMEYQAGLPAASSYWFMHMLEAESSYRNLLKHGEMPQQARDVLPNALKTEIVMTANLREWRHVFKMRCDKSAHPSIREIMVPLQQELQGVLPEIFGEQS